MSASEDLILSIIITFAILLVTLLITPIATIGISYLGLLLCADKSIVGGAKEMKKSLKKISKVIKLKLKSFKHENIMINPINELKNTYTMGIITDEELKRQVDFNKIAKKIYKDEKKDFSYFDIDMESIVKLYKGDIIKTTNKISYSEIKKLTNARLLTDSYPQTDYLDGYTKYGITNIEYTPYNPIQYNKYMNIVYKHAIINSIRELTSKEKSEIQPIVDMFQSGKLTHPEFTINFRTNKPIKMSNCRARNIPYKYSNLYKKLHWGQRKLILTEIDFFNRCAHHMGIKKFKDQKISVVYPGSAHGDKLMMQMEMFPNIIYYLWDPAKFNTILYISDFIRRGLEISFSHTPEQLQVAKKFVNRVFINMEMTNDTFLKYHNNSTTGHISDNYDPEYGFFVQKSADYYLKYKKDNNDTSPTLFVSDIRMFTNTMAYDLILNNYIKDYSNIISLRIASEKSKGIDYTRDMQLQRDWFDMVKAEYGLFKFKLKSKVFSRYDSQYPYLDGDIILQAWAPVASTETRLYVSPDHKKTNAFYDIKSYTNKCKTYNSIMRVADLNSIKLSDIGIDVCNGTHTIGEVWKPFLPYNLIGMDAIIETHILYDYLCIYKDKNDIKHTDIILVISDLTQSLLDKSNYKNILAYFDDDVIPDNILNSRKKYHESFIHRLDYNSKWSDFEYCNIKKPKKWVSQTIRN
jgi:hypothetical protein